MGSSRTWVSLAVGSDGVALFTISNPLINALAPPLVAGLNGKYVEAMNRRDVKAIMLTGLILKHAAVTNAPRVIAEFMISKMEFDSFFQFLVVGSECERAKLFPEPYLKALEVLKVFPEHTFVFEILRKEGGLLLKDNFDGGATWAFEVGSQFMICPIIVEYLNPPRQMLVKMFCEECGLFLEIANLVRGLGLTI